MNYNLIKQAIEEKKCLNFLYDSHLRKVVPYLMGTKNGKYHVLCYQYGGTSLSGLSADTTQNWRCLELDKISAIEINNDELKIPNNHSQKQNCIENIEVELNYQV
ncbi:MAG: WYL domain-containing protein [Thermonemataceae bacterium]|nr:WYL domain-containing protein [Thermonemataceae bacterium]